LGYYLIEYDRDLRISLDTVKLETERQSGFHMGIAQQIRTDLEAPTAAFNARQIHHKKTYQTGIEKEFKNKQIQESYVSKSREKYEQDCLRINSFTAQASLVQGKDLEKINLKLERTQQTVQTNERDFANYSKALQDTVQKWEQDWKSFCDSCQDLEEHRLEFMKDNLWAYANAVSTVCVADDEVRIIPSFMMISC
jgi:Ni,Fe-hydrogenase I large subunit